MITEDYVSFETAKLLKEKGFDEPCHALYYRDGNMYFGLDVDSYLNSNLNDDNYACSTLQMTMKWLREVHNIFIQVELYKYDDYCFEVFQNTHRLIVEIDEVYNSYEVACEVAIKYSLENLI